MQALSVAARHLSQRERRVRLCETKAFLSEKGGTAQAVTEGATRGQVCIRAILIYSGSQFAPASRLSLWESWHLRSK